MPSSVVVECTRELYCTLTQAHHMLATYSTCLDTNVEPCISILYVTLVKLDRNQVFYANVSTEYTILGFRE